MSNPNINVLVGGPVHSTVVPTTYKTKILKGNLDFASQVVDENTKYVIKYDFDLGGREVAIPDNCVLEFDGGSMNNGTIVGQNTYLNGTLKNIFSDTIIIDGTWNVPYISTEMFSDLNYDNSLKNLNKLCSPNIQNTVVVNNHGYDYYFISEFNRDSLFRAVENTTYIINAVIKERTWDTSEKSGMIFYITTEAKNVVIEGSGSLIGNVASDDDTVDENLSAINVWMNGGTEDVDSTNLKDNLIIRGIHIENFGCDAIRLCNCCKIRIENCEIVHCNRNGISFIGSTMCVVENNKISRIPHSAFDFEPNDSLTSYRSDTTTFIINNVVYDCVNVLDVSTSRVSINTSISFKNNYIKNCAKYTNFGRNLYNVILENNTFIDDSLTERQIYGNFANNMTCHVVGNLFKSVTVIQLSHTNKDIIIKDNVFEIEGSGIKVNSASCIASGNIGKIVFYAIDCHINIHNNFFASTGISQCSGNFSENEIIGSLHCDGVKDGNGLYVCGNKIIGTKAVRDENLPYCVCLRAFANRSGFKKSMFQNNIIIPKMTYDAVLYASLNGSVVKDNIILIEAGVDENQQSIAYNTGFLVIATKEADGGITTALSSLFENNKIISLDNSAFDNDYDIERSEIIANVKPNFIYNGMQPSVLVDSLSINNELGNLFYDKDTDKNTYFSVKREKVSTLATDGQESAYVANPCELGKTYLFDVRRLNASSVLKVKFCKYNNSLEDSIDIPIYYKSGNAGDGKAESKTFVAPNPSEYPYIYLYTNYSYNNTLYNLIELTRVFRDYDGAISNVNRAGSFNNKPSGEDVYVGFRYFCTDKQTTEGATNGIEIIYKGSDVWVDALGRTVS